MHTFSRAEVGELWRVNQICSCTTGELRMFKKNLKYIYFMTNENYMKFRIQCLYVTFYGNTATLICWCVTYSCFHALRGILVLTSCDRHCIWHSNGFTAAQHTTHHSDKVLGWQHFEYHTYQHTTTFYYYFFTTAYPSCQNK